jgi:hypothetical protein
MMWDLKETAKWASSPEEKKAAIRSLSAQGAAAVPSLEEIMGVTAYDDIKAACAEAIRSAREKNDGTAEKNAAGEEGEAVVAAGANLPDLPP